MKRFLLVDIQFGASGDMLLGSLLDLGLDPAALRTELVKLGIPGWSISPEKVVKHHMHGTAAGVACDERGIERHLREILSIVDRSSLEERDKKAMGGVFDRLARAEAAVHGCKPEEVHFHEVGALDSIIDIAGFCLGLRLIGIEGLYFNEFSFGTGSVNSSHGELPVPVPAVLELARGYRVRYTGRPGELTTPTAAAILTALGLQLQTPVSYTLVNTGIGFGTRDYGFPSYTRSSLVETEDNSFEEVYQLECDIDDMNPQFYPHLTGRLLDQGALDVYTTPAGMKKGRPGNLLTVIMPRERADMVKETVYRETTTLGVRLFPVIREKLARRIETVNLHGFEVRVKTGYYRDTAVNIQPEFEDCRKLADKTGKPLKEVFREVLAAHEQRGRS